MPTNKRSLGGIRSNPHHQSNPRAPEGLGRILLTRATVEALYEDLQQSGSDKAEAKLACWSNVRSLGKGKLDHWLTIEVQPLGPNDRAWREAEKPEARSLEDFFK